MTTIVTRAGKGSPLTNVEVDANFTNLNNDKIEKTGGTITANSSSAALTIAQAGSGDALRVEDASGDTTPFVIDQSGNVVIGHTAALNTGVLSGTSSLQKHGSTSVSQSSLGLVDWRTQAARPAILSFAKSISGTIGTRSALVAVGSALGMLSFNGDDGTAWAESTRVSSEVDAAPAAGSMPGRLVFATTPSGSATPVERMRIDSAGQVSIPANNTTAALKITQTGSGNALVVEDAASPDTTPFVIDADGRVIVGSSTPVSYGSDIGTARTQYNYTVGTGLVVSRWSANQPGQNLYLAKSRGAEVGTRAQVALNDVLGTLGFVGDDGTSFVSGAKIMSEVDATPGTNSMPGRLIISTTPSGSSTPVERMRIDSAGNVGLGGAAPSGQRLRLSGSLTGNVNSYGSNNVSTVASDVTSNAVGSGVTLGTAAATFTLGNLIANNVSQGTFGAGSTVARQFGFRVDPTVVGAINNYGFYGAIPAGTGRWNFYAAGTAANYFAGNVGIGGTTIDTERLRVVGASGELSSPLTSSEIFTTTAATFEANGGTNVVIASSATETGALAFGRVGAWADGMVNYNHAAMELGLYAGGDKAITCHNTGGVSISRTAVTAPAPTDGNVFSGTYTPTLTNTTNVAASTAYVCQYMRVGNVVTVSGTINVTPTATGPVYLGISLPVSSNFTSSPQAGGIAFDSTYSQIARVYGDTTNDRLALLFTATNAAATDFSFTVTYRVI